MDDGSIESTNAPNTTSSTLTVLTRARRKKMVVDDEGDENFQTSTSSNSRSLYRLSGTSFS